MGGDPSTPAPPDASKPDPPRFVPLDLPRRLWVPIGVRAPLDVGRAKSPGSRVARGEWLTEEDAESQPAPLAPAAGHASGEGLVSLFNAREVPAVAIDTTDGTGVAPPDSFEAPPAEAVPAVTESLSDFDPLPTAAVRNYLSGLGPDDLAPVIEQLRVLGVCADRWTSPDLTGQLADCLHRPPDIVLCSLLDPDPAAGVNRACAEAFPAEVVAAVAALAKLTGAGRGWLAVSAEEDPAAWAAVRRVAAEVAGDLRLVPVDNDYPQPDPTLLLYALTGRPLRPGQLPTAQGVLLLDAAAAAAVGRALVAGTPMLRVPLAIHDRTPPAADVEREDAEQTAGPAIARERPGTTHLVSVAVGTPLRHVLERVGIVPAVPPDRPAGGGGGEMAGCHGLELRAGGPLREMRVTGDCVVSGCELSLFVAPREPDVNPDPCIRCGWCIEGCPVRIHPAGLLEAAQAEDVRLARRYGLDACIECGICSYVCPSHLPLLHGIRTLRGERELAAED